MRRRGYSFFSKCKNGISIGTAAKSLKLASSRPIGKLAAAKKKFTEQVAPLNSDLHYGDGFLGVGLRSNTGPTHSAAN
jgi:hypothetical protein